MRELEFSLRRIILKRSDSYDMPTEFPDRDEYLVTIERINNLCWVSLNRDSLPIDNFEIIISNGEVINVIEHSLDDSTTSLHIYYRKNLWKFKMKRQEFELYEQRKQRKAKLKKLYG